MLSPYTDKPLWFLVIFESNEEILNILLEKDSSFIDDSFPEGKIFITPLSTAFHAKKIEAYKRIISLNPDFNKVIYDDPKTKTQLNLFQEILFHTHKKSIYFDLAIQKTQENSLKKINILVKEHRVSFLFAAVLSQDTILIRNALIEGNNPNEVQAKDCDFAGETPLSLAASLGIKNILICFLKYDCSWETPIFSKRFNGKTPYELVMQNCPNEFLKSFIFLIIKNKKPYTKNKKT